MTIVKTLEWVMQEHGAVVNAWKADGAYHVRIGYEGDDGEWKLVYGHDNWSLECGLRNALELMDVPSGMPTS